MMRLCKIQSKIRVELTRVVTDSKKSALSYSKQFGSVTDKFSDTEAGAPENQQMS